MNKIGIAVQGKVYRLSHGVKDEIALNRDLIIDAISDANCIDSLREVHELIVCYATNAIEDFTFKKQRLNALFVITPYNELCNIKSFGLKVTYMAITHGGIFKKVWESKITDMSEESRKLLITSLVEADFIELSNDGVVK